MVSEASLKQQKVQGSFQSLKNGIYREQFFLVRVVRFQNSGSKAVMRGHNLTEGKYSKFQPIRNLVSQRTSLCSERFAFQSGLFANSTEFYTSLISMDEAVAQTAEEN